jgi:ATP-dependent helicase Lhr and Lhr-like helicase
LDIARLGDFLKRAKGRLRDQSLPHVSPLSVPILLEIGKDPMAGAASESLLREAAKALIAEAAQETPLCSS